MEPHSNINWHRLVRYLTGESTPEEEEKTQTWILENSERARLMDELKSVWDITEMSSKSRDVDSAWEKVKSQLDEGDSSRMGDTEAIVEDGSLGSCNRNSTPERRTRSGSHLYERRRSFSRVGMFLGVVLVTSLLAIVSYDLSSSLKEEDSPQVFTTEPGQRATVRLSDGTNVRLNVDSRLKLPPDFGTQNRTVHLQGEAYFEVTRDTTRPFIVKMQGAEAKALGTAFNVDAYAQSGKREVAVTEGMVALQTAKRATQDTVNLRAHHLGVVFGKHLQAVRQNAAVEKRVAWKNGQLVFDDTPFNEVAHRLGRWYDVEVESRVESEEVDQLNASFHEESLEEAVKAIAAALDLQYRKDGGKIVFYQRG